MHKKQEWLIKYYSSIPSRKIVDLINDKRVKDDDKHAMKVILKRRGEENAQRKRLPRGRGKSGIGIYRVGNMRIRTVQGGKVSPR